MGRELGWLTESVERWEIRSWAMGCRCDQPDAEDCIDGVMLPCDCECHRGPINDPAGLED